MNPLQLWACQELASMISGRVAPLGRRSRSRIVSVLLPARTPAAFGFVAFGALMAVLALGAFLVGVVFLVALGLAGATRRACFAPLGFVGAFCSWVSVLGAACASGVVVASFSIEIGRAHV